MGGPWKGFPKSRKQNVIIFPCRGFSVDISWSAECAVCVFFGVLFWKHPQLSQHSAQAVDDVKVAIYEQVGASETH